MSVESLLNRYKKIHEQQMKKILFMVFSSVYKDILGFKGGTLAYLCYNLPRFSTDLDIDLLDLSKEEEVVAFFNEHLPLLGEIERPMLGRDLHRWKFNYDPQSWNIKIELNKRENKYTSYEWKRIDICDIQCQTLVSMVSNKLLALGDRRYNRDLYDIHYFLSLGYVFDENIIHNKTQKTLKEFIQYVIAEIPHKYKENTILHQLGEVLEHKQKPRVKQCLAHETIHLLQQYIDTH